MTIQMLIGYYLVVNLLLFILMGLDKRKSRRDQWRVPEKRLWLLALLGGALGGVMGMKVFRHKTKHSSFKIGMPVLLLIHVLLVGYVVQKLYLG
ncbi:DUF1294 domain-containing protein [Thalassobacillus hwangdonensis]|uniref:DUF1294 domain-containing protein n=1 Tax=Thalassobacillus hwangdonensis TaxID=546108 RepID=A0ABW3KZK3_9BACI